MRLSWEDLFQRIEQCQACPLCKGIHYKVPGQGNIHAKIMFIGEGPGADEDLQGVAFVGAAGKLLTKMIAAMGMTRDDVYICNIVKCRPPHNRAPEQEEMEACIPFLREQFLMVHPKIIVLLGATAARGILGNQVRITRDRGKWVEKNGFFFMPTFHPAALLRDPAKKRDSWQDLQMVMAKLKELEAQEGADTQSAQ